MTMTRYDVMLTHDTKHGNESRLRNFSRCITRFFKCTRKY